MQKLHAGSIEKNSFKPGMTLTTFNSKSLENRTYRDLTYDGRKSSRDRASYATDQE